MFIIDDTTNNDVLFPRGLGRGLVPRDFTVDPVSMFASPASMPLIPESEYEARIKEQTERQSSLAHIRKRADRGKKMWCLNQSTFGYCWSHSTTHAIMLRRAADGQPYVRLSAFAVAAILKGGRNEGGWCGLSGKFVRDVGVPSLEFWPEGTADLKFDTPAMRENAARYRVQEDWYDLGLPVHGQKLTRQQIMTLLLNNIPVPADFAWWGHSVCLMRAVIVERGVIGIEFLNSWYEQPGKEWGDEGTGVLVGEKAISMGAIGIGQTLAA